MKQLARTSTLFGAALRRRRVSLGISQATLGGRINLRQATISKLESGSPGTSLGTILSVLAALNLEIVIQSRTKGRMSDIEKLF